VWQRIQTGASALVQSMNAGWEGMKADFLHALHDMGARFASFIGGVAGALNSVFGTNLSTSPMGDMLLGLQTAGNDALERRNASRSAASGMWADVSAPLQSIEALRKAMSDAAEETETAAAAVDRMNAALGGVSGGSGGGAGGAAKAARDAIKGVADEARRAAEAAAQFGKELVGGFVSDLRNGLKNGEGFFQSFANAANRALDKVVDKLLNNVLDAIFQVNGAASGMGGGGLFGGLLGGIGRIFGFADGGYTGRGHKYQPAGIVHAGEFVFSKAATDRIGIGNLNRLHARAKGYAEGGYVGPAPIQLSGGGSRQERVEVDVRVTVDKRGELRAFVERTAVSMSTQVVRQATPALTQTAIAAVEDHSRRHPRYLR
jgi:hypothetical protein